MTRLGMTKERFIMIYEGDGRDYMMSENTDKLELYLRKQVYILFKNYNAYVSIAKKYERKIALQALYGPSAAYNDAFSEVDALLKLRAKKVKFLNFKLLADELMDNAPEPDGKMAAMFFIQRKNSYELSLAHNTDTKGVFRSLNRAIIASAKYLLRHSNTYYMQIIDGVRS